MAGFFHGVCFVLLGAPISHCLGLSCLIALSVGAFFFLGLLVRRSFRSTERQVNGIEGEVCPGFELLAEAFRESFRRGDEQGAAFAVYYKGQLVVDLWGGFADFESGRLRSADATTLVFSTTKAVAAICIAHLWDRGLLDYDSPVVKYWPEFGKHNKESVTVKTLLSHRAGLFAIRDKHKFSEMRDDPEKIADLLACQEPFWAPGTGQAYHALTFGLYASQLVERTDPNRRNLAKYFEEEIAKPFDIDFVIGERQQDFHRACHHSALRVSWKTFLTRVIPAVMRFCAALLYSLVKYKTIYLKYTIGNPTDWKSGQVNNPDFRCIPCASSHGVGTARALAKLMGILANGGKLKEKVLLTPQAIDLLGRPLSEDNDRFLLRKVTFGPGTMLMPLNSADHPGQKRRYAFGHPGAGGQTAFSDPQEQVAWCYVTNFENRWLMLDLDPRYMDLEKTIYRCLEDLKKTK